MLIGPAGYGKTVLARQWTANKRHAWNAIKIEDEWHLVYATWGAGSIKDKKFVSAGRGMYQLKK